MASSLSSLKKHISDDKLLILVRENKNDFLAFIEAVENYFKKGQSKNKNHH